MEQTGKEDKLLWALTENDTFIVKSAYYMALNLNWDKRGELSNVEKQSSLWKSIWDLMVPVKVHNFLW